MQATCDVLMYVLYIVQFGAVCFGFAGYISIIVAAVLLQPIEWVFVHLNQVLYI